MAAEGGLQACASAPGKLILFGEHSVVYGYTAVAAAISDMRVTAQVDLVPNGQLLEAVLHDLPSAAPTRGLQRRPAPVSMRCELHRLLSTVSPTAADHWRSPTPPSAAHLSALSETLSGSPPGPTPTPPSTPTPPPTRCYALHAPPPPRAPTSTAAPTRLCSPPHPTPLLPHPYPTPTPHTTPHPPLDTHRRSPRLFLPLLFLP